MLRLKNILLFALLMCFVSFFPAKGESDPGVQFSEANGFYATEKYAEAIKGYIALAAAGYESEALFYNLANAYYKTGDYTNSIYYYEKAKKINPGDDDINYNLRMANLHTIDKIDPLPKVFYEKWIERFVYGNSLSTRAWTAIGFLWLTVAMVVVYLFTGKVAIKKISFLAAAAGFLLTIFTLFLTWKQYTYLSSQKEAIIFSESVYIRSSPDENSATLFRLHSGTKVQILDELKSWKKVRIANGNEGWIEAADIKGI